MDFKSIKVYGCQTCLQVIEHNQPTYALDARLPDDDKTTLKDALMDCIPELLFESTDIPVLCSTCFQRIVSMYQFKQSCIEVQSKIYGYLQQINSSKVDTGEIALYYKRIETITQEVSPSSMVVAPYIENNSEATVQLNTSFTDFFVPTYPLSEAIIVDGGINNFQPHLNEPDATTTNEVTFLKPAIPVKKKKRRKQPDRILSQVHIDKFLKLDKS